MRRALMRSVDYHKGNNVVLMILIFYQYVRHIDTETRR